MVTANATLPVIEEVERALSYNAGDPVGPLKNAVVDAVYMYGVLSVADHFSESCGGGGGGVVVNVASNTFQPRAQEPPMEPKSRASQVPVDTRQRPEE
jgi:hypothetical protein